MDAGGDSLPGGVLCRGGCGCVCVCVCGRVAGRDITGLKDYFFLYQEKSKARSH